MLTSPRKTNIPRRSDTAARLSHTPGGLPLSTKLIAITIFLPEGLSFYFAGMRLTFIRVIFLLLAPVIFTRIGRMWVTGKASILLSDLLVLATSIWMIISVALVDNLSDALAHEGPIVLEYSIGYFALRTVLTERGQALTFLNLLCVVISLVAVVGLLDTFTDTYFTHDLVDSLTGYAKIRQHDYRYDILRATSTLEHPIHLGIVCAFALVLAFCLPVKNRTFIISACSVGLLISISSGPIQAAFVGLCLAWYDRALSKLQQRWLLLIGAVMVGLVFIYLMLQSPIGFINEHLIFQTSSGWYRTWEWQVVGDAINTSPWLGVAYEWPKFAERVGMLPSVDSLWLDAALVHGIPGAVLLGLSYIAAVLSPVKSLSKLERRIATILSILILLTVYLSFTVDFWAAAWIFASVIVGLRAHLGSLAGTRVSKVGKCSLDVRRPQGNLQGGKINCPA